MTSETQTLEKPGGRGPMPPAGGDERFFGRPGGDGALPLPAVNPLRIGVWLIVAVAVVLFAAFTSTYVSRRVASDWRTGPLPLILWVNTAVLAMSSATMEWARRRATSGAGAIADADATGARRALWVTALLGVVFLAGQIAAWRQLISGGVFLAANPHADFFYLLTGAHAVHLAGGLGGLGYALWKVRRLDAAATVGAVAIYWHFVDVLWIYLFAMLFWL